MPTLGSLPEQSNPKSNLDKRAGILFLCPGGLPEDDTQVPKHVGFDTYHELYLIQCICLLTYFFTHIISVSVSRTKTPHFLKFLSPHRDTCSSIFILTEKHWNVLKITDATPNPPDKASRHVSV